MDLVLISPLISAFSPTVKTPSELMSPSTLPSMSSSFWNLIEPLISTSLERMSLPPWSAIGLGFGFELSIMFGFGTNSSRLARWLWSSGTGVRGSSRIGGAGLCGTNLLSMCSNVTLADACQRILFCERKVFYVSSFNSHSVNFACWVLRGENQERWRLGG